MKIKRAQGLRFTIPVIILVFLLFSVTGVFARDVSLPDAWIGERSVTISTDNYDVVRLRLVMATPDGIEEITSKGEDLIWNSANHPDGFYRYEADVLVLDEEGEKDGAMMRGSFNISNGIIVIPEEKVGSLGQPADETNLFSTVLTAVVDFLVPSACAANVMVSGVAPRLTWDDVTDGDTADWYLSGYNNLGTDNDYWKLSDSTAGVTTNPIAIQGGDLNNNSLVVDSLGDISLANDRIFIDRDTGRVGFGTIAPLQALHGKTTAGKASMFLRFENTAESTWDIGQDSAGGFDIRINKNRTAGNPTGTMLAIDDETGWVGLGTTNPGGNLHIYSAATSDTFAGMGPDVINGPGFNYGYAGSSFGRGAGFFNVRPDASATGVNPSLRFMTENIERMIITNDGNVGIGTSAPSSKLHVMGSIRITGGSFIDDGTKLRAPDYVFEDDYKLRSLADLQAYIEEHHHLPGVKSAKEIKEEGLNLSQSQMSLLEKVEELTLYTLRQQQELEAKKQQLNSLEERFAVLESKLVRMSASDGVVK